MSKSTTILLVRHADAGSRSGWKAPDALRPLTDKGRAQAIGLLDLLHKQRVDRILTSHYLRCIETMTPMAAMLEQTVEVEPTLTEGEDPLGAVELVRSLAVSGTHAALCSHGDVVPGALEALSDADGLDLGPIIQSQKGSAWILKCEGKRVLTAVYHPPRQRSL